MFRCAPHRPGEKYVMCIVFDMKKQIITWIKLPVIYILLLLLFACQNQTDDLEAIKAFRPEDKYFKASLVSLHYIIETSEISRIVTRPLSFSPR